MPQALALGLFYIGAPLSVVNGVIGIGSLGFLGSVVNIGIGLGVGEVAALLTRPEAPKPEDVQTSLRIQPTYRTRHYGWRKTSGNWLFCENYEGSLHKVINFGQGKMVEIAEVWIDDNIVTFGEDFYTEDSPYQLNRVRFETRPGNPTETFYSALHDVFPEWTAKHRGDGIATAYIKQKALGQTKVFEVFPNGKDTLYRVVAKFTEVLNVTTGVTEWSDNAALIIRDFMCHVDGARIPADQLSTPQAVLAWKEAQARCDLARDLKLGGTEPWYRIWGSYNFNERPGDVLSRMMAVCNARPIVTRDGGMAIDVRKYDESEIAPLVLDNSVITGFQELGRGRDFLTTANTIKSTFTAVDHDWQSADADPWVDAEDVLLRGEIIAERPFIMAPSHGQCRYLMKLESYRANPEWVATFHCRKIAAQLFQWPLVRVDYWIGPVHIEGVFEITAFNFVLSDQGILTGFTVSVASMPLEAGSWDAATEEGDAPVADDSEGAHGVPTPDRLDVTIRRKTVSGVVVPFALLTFDEAPSEALTIEIRGRNVDDSQWIPIAVDDGATEAESFVLADGETYVFEIHYMTTGGRKGAWFTSDEIVAVADTVAPAALTSFTQTAAAPHLGNAIFSFVTPNDSHLKSVRLFRVASGSPFDPTAVSPVVSLATAPLSTFGYVDGDATTSNLIANGNFASSASWTLPTGWTIGSGVLHHASSASGTNAEQTLSLTTGAYYRGYYEVTNWSAGSVRMSLETPRSDGVLRGSNGNFLERIQAVSGNTKMTIRSTSSLVCDVDNVALYLETASCAPQGVWDYYAVPFNGSGIAGTPSGPVTVTII